MSEPSTLEKIRLIIANCVCSCSFMVNDHKEVYQTTVEAIDNLESCGYRIPDDIKREMVKRDCIVDIQMYPRTPVGSITILHYDFDAAVAEAYDALVRDFGGELPHNEL